MKRVAIPVFDNHLSEYFGQCSYYEIFDINKNGVFRKTVVMPEKMAIEDFPSWLEKQGVTDVIVFRIDKKIISLFASKKVNLFVGIAKKTPLALIDDYLNGRLESDKKMVAELTS